MQSNTAILISIFVTCLPSFLFMMNKPGGFAMILGQIAYVMIIVNIQKLIIEKNNERNKE